MEFLAQVERAGLSNEMAGLFIFLFVSVAGAIAWWQFNLKIEFDEAMKEFKRDPTNQVARQRLIDASKYRSDDGKSSREVIALLEVQLDCEQQVLNQKSELVQELKSLSHLHANGDLTDAEFEQAKAKLLK
ncbi:MAG: SHOCT domain-containing protein [Armatimonadota bacterium]